MVLDNPKPEWIAQELARCFCTGFKGFLHWCRRYYHILDKETHTPILFDPWPAQIKFLRLLYAGKWVWVLKARQVGFTTSVGTYCHHRMFGQHVLINVTAQDRPHAADFLADRIKFAYERFPAWMRPTVGACNTERFAYGGLGSECRAEASTTKTARSTSADVNVFDEAAFQDHLREALKASEPTVEAAKGQMIVLSTGDGPLGRFAEGWRDAVKGESKYKPQFYSWRERPGRDDVWYKREKDAHKSDPTFMMHEYPSTPEEAFAAAAGRVFPGFSRSVHIVHRDRPEGAKRYRSFDWGESEQHAFVCLWAWYEPDKNPSFTIEPDCWTDEDAIDQMLSYRRHEKTGEIVKDHDDFPDALRYLVTTFRFTGHVHVYRILFIRDSAKKASYVDIARRVRELGGERLVNVQANLWMPAVDGVVEMIEGSVGDRSRPGMRRQFLDTAGMSILPHVKPLASGRSSRGEVEDGVSWVNSLLTGSFPWEPEVYRTVREEYDRSVIEGTLPPARSVGDLWRQREAEMRLRGKRRPHLTGAMKI